jgi:nicotinamide mononucleotide transporter
MWIAVNTLAVALYASRGLTLIAILYAACWCNARFGWWRWRREIAAC